MTSPVNNQQLKVYETEEIAEIVGKDFFKQNSYKESAISIADKTIEFANAAFFGFANQYIPTGNPISLAIPAIQNTSQDFSKRQAKRSIDTSFNSENIKWVNEQAARIMPSSAPSNTPKEITNSK